MKNLIIIPARGGSKRLKNKNLKKLGRFALVERTIMFAKKINITPYILMTTDSREILKVGVKHGVLTPWLRPKNLSGDKSESIEFLFHGLKWFKQTFGEIDNIVLLQPTSPYRSVKTFKKMYEIFKVKKNSIVTISNYDNSTKNRFIIYDGKLKKKNQISKDQSYKINGNIYINSVKNLLKYKNFVNKETVPFLLKNKKEIIDIDYPKDFDLAKKYLLKKV